MPLGPFAVAGPVLVQKAWEIWMTYWRGDIDLCLNSAFARLVWHVVDLIFAGAILSVLRACCNCSCATLALFGAPQVPVAVARRTF